MLISFTAAVIFAAALLYLPGYLVLRGFGYRRSFAVGIAPSAGLMVIGLLAIVYSMVGMKSSPIDLFFLPLAASICIYLVQYLRKRSERNGAHFGQESISIATLVIVIAVGVLFGMLFFVRRLPSLDAIFQQWDYPHHLNEVRAFIDSGDLSPLHGSSYVAGQSIDPFVESTSFYPSGWHMVCALVSMECGVSAPLAINAVDFTFSFIVFPVSMEALLVSLFPNKKPMPAVAVVACMSLAVFPWGLLTYGPVFPNLAGFAVLPGMICAFMNAVDERKGTMVLIWAASCIGIFFLHPNALFSMGIYLAPFIIHTIRSRNLTLRLGQHRMKANSIAIVFAVLCVVLWTLAFNSSFMTSTATVSWRKYASVSQAVVDLIALSYVDGFPPFTAAQLIPAVVLIVGVISLWRNRKSSDSWMLWPFAISAVLMVVAESFSGDSLIKHFLTSFWYTDPYRVAAMTTIFSMPILVKGIYCCIEKADASSVATHDRRLHCRNAAVVTVAYFVLVFYPTFQVAGIGTVNMAFSDVRDNIRVVYGYRTPLTAEEHGFLAKVKEIVGDDLVINQPFDGSMMAYGTDDINCYYRYFSGYGGSTETAESVSIRQRLNLIATDQKVQEAVQFIGAKYVLVLDNGDMEHSFALSAYQEKQWAGLEDITDETPGFTPVLEEGDLCLYRIDDAA